MFKVKHIGSVMQSCERSIWNWVGFYMIHTFLDPSVESQLESFLSLMISFLVQLQHLLLPSLIVTSFQVRVDTPLPLLSCCISGLGPEGLCHNLQWCKLKVVTSKHEDFNLMFTNHGKEDGIYPLKEIAMHKTKIQDLL